MSKILRKILGILFIRYFITGFLTVTIDFVLMRLLISYGLDTVLSNFISVFVSVIFNFFMQNYWSFQAGSSNKFRKSVKYLFLTIFNYLFNTYGFFLAYRELGIEDLLYENVDLLPRFLEDGFLVKIIITAMIMFWNFFLFKYWVFNVEKKNI